MLPSPKKFATWLLLLCIATSADGACSDVTKEAAVVSLNDPLTVDTTLHVDVRYTVGQHDSNEIRVKLITRGKEADLVKLVVTGSIVTVTTTGTETGTPPDMTSATATSGPGPLLPLAVAATAWAVTPSGGARRVSLASSLALVAWTVSGVDAQPADEGACTSSLEIELELEFPRQGILGYDQAMQNGGITLADTVRLAGCVPGFNLQEATCDPTITDFDVYAEPSSQAFKKWSPDARYPEECPVYIHDMFAVLGEDGKVYPTWHPPVYTDVAANYTCNFGHEHGDDPSTSNVFGDEPVPFGFVNEQHYADDPSLQRHESHVGHKLQVGNDVKVCWLNQQNDCEGVKHITTCSVIIKLHQGTSSEDAFVNNLHEVFYFARCEHGGGTRDYVSGRDMKQERYEGVLEYKIKYLHGFGHPGELTGIDLCPKFNDKFVPNPKVLPFTPNDAPKEGHRKMVDNTCVDAKMLVGEGKRTSWVRSNEHWVINFHAMMSRPEKAHYGNDIMYGNPYIFVQDAARYYDATSPETNFLKYFVDLCYETGAKQIRGDALCEQVRQEKDRVTWDDPRSPWKGGKRSMSMNGLRVENPGPATVFYSDTYGQELVTDPSVCGPNKDGVGCITQYIGIASTGSVSAALVLPDKDWAVPSTHPPN